MEADHHHGNQSQNVSQKFPREQKGKQPMIFDNRNMIAMNNRQRVHDWVPYVSGSPKAENAARPTKPVQPVAKSFSKPKTNSTVGSKSFKSDKMSGSVQSSQNPVFQR